MGDLNFFIGFGESWGSQAQVDPLFGYIRNSLEQQNLTDVPMIRPLPTWRNRRVGDSSLARRLDRFLIKVPLLHHLNRYRQWASSGGISDHAPIYLEILGPKAKPKSPYKFNHVWLQEPRYIKMVTDYWKENIISSHRSLAEGFCHNLSQLKHLSISWAIEEKQRDDQTIPFIESELNALTYDNNKGF